MDKVKEDTLEQVNKDIETTKTELNKKFKKHKIKQQDNLMKWMKDVEDYVGGIGNQTVLHNVL